MNRNGTTYLANFIIEHFEVSALHHEKHFGFLESNLMHNHMYFSKYPKESFYDQLKNEYFHRDAVKLFNVPLEEIDKMGVDNFTEFYLKMLEYTSNGKKFILIKLAVDCFLNNPYENPVISEILTKYKAPKFISIQRNYEDYLNSQIYMNQRTYNGLAGSFKLMLKKITATAYYYYFYKRIKIFVGSEHGLNCNFDESLRDKESLLRKLEDFIGARSYERKIFNYRKNTSHFKRDNPRIKAPLLKFVFSNIPIMGKLV